MKLVTSVRDVNGAPVATAGIGIVYARKGPGREVVQEIAHISPGELFERDLAVNQLQVQVDDVDHAKELVTLKQDGGGRWLVDNPASTVTPSGDGLTLDVVIGSVRFAPTIDIGPDQKIQANPNAIYVRDGGGGNWIYRGGDLNTETIHRLLDPVAGDPDKMEWKRFHSQPGPEVALRERGLFVFLEYGYPVGGGRRGPRFLVLVWVPTEPLGPTPQVSTFFSPTTTSPAYPVDTYPFVGNYPYAFLPLRPTQPVRVSETAQPYVNLGLNYLNAGGKIVYQLLAAGRNPVVVMPIQASTNWGPFATQSGQWRLLKEVMRFLYAHQLVSSIAKPTTHFTLTSGQPNTFPPSGLFTTETVPTKFKLTMSAFSAGINAIVSLCIATRLDTDRYNASIFGSPVAPFLDHWVELWDIDGVDSSGWRHMQTAFAAWRSGGRRRLRAYHSATTFRFGGANGLVEPNQIVRKTGKHGFVEQGTSKDGTTTWVGFSNSILEGNKKDPEHEKTLPEFGSFDAHHMVPAIAFGHAALFKVP